VTLPAALRAAVEERISQNILSAAAVSGGCISHTAKLELDNRERAFLKWASTREHTPGLFEAEAHALEIIAATATVRVPSVITYVDASSDYSFLVLEWLEPGPSTRQSWRALGADLAQLHRVRSERYGWNQDNFIGSLPQSNRAHAKWAEFWRDERLSPQLRLAENHFAPRDRHRLEQLLSVCESRLPVADDEGPSLLHGDLWNGNVHMLAAGAAAVVDPSSYYGHREVDLAMAALFGGFPQEFYEAYEDAWPLREDSTQRIPLYQLYYLLVHVNLFGGSYVRNTMSIVKQLGF
jgi:protein-ribulosamine 3-kinase